MRPDGVPASSGLTNDTIATCANASLGAANQGFHDTRVMPYIGMTIAGWVWYQGENDMHNFFGNSALKTGYVEIRSTRLIHPCIHASIHASMVALPR